MTAVGMFAGRGDVVLAMGVTFVLGLWVGYQVSKLIYKRKKQA
jgi:hypothetical protein